jgi:carbonic anhydrase/acetyltransferase-like protein (isoleucine patch superfamily)
VPDLTKLKRGLRLAAHMALAVAPRALKVPVYRRVFGFEIDDSAQIGISVLDVDRLRLGPEARIGHGNLLTRTQEVSLERGAEIGFLNVVRGGEQVRMGAYSTVFRFNVLNSIPDNDCEGPTDPQLSLDAGAFVVSGHRLDFTDRISIGKNVILAGRNSSLWTHNRQATRPIDIGDFCYVGSEVRVGPGARLGAYSILGMGGVLTGEAAERTVHGGVPAKPIRPITQEDEARLRKKTKRTIPPDAY